MQQAQPEIGQSQQIQNFCTLCRPIGRKCPNNYLSLNHPEWSELKEDWDGQKQKENECKEEESKDSKQKELKQKSKMIACQSHQYTPSFHTDSDSEGFVPVLTDMFVPAPEEEALKEEKNKEKDKNFETDYDSGDTVDIQRSEPM